VLDRITPVILTLNEEANISRTLESLSWAKTIVVVDSGSSDRTCSIIKSYSNTRLFERKFDSHAQQWNFAIQATGIDSEWVLALDADHIPTTELLDELAALQPPEQVAGYCITFFYCVMGQRLRGSLYPPLISLYRHAAGRYVQQGHTQRLQITGAVECLHGRMLHDDRKQQRQWFASQLRYMKLESGLINATPWRNLSPSNRLRCLLVVAPMVVLFWSLVVKGTLFDGPAGWFYSAQRVVAEMLLSVRLLYDYCAQRPLTQHQAAKSKSDAVCLKDGDRGC